MSITADEPGLVRIAEVAKALAHPHRLAILDVTSVSDLCVEDIAEATGLTVGNASQHLQQLRRSGVMAARRDGKKVFYGLADKSIFNALSALSTLGLATAEESGIERVGAAKLKDMLARGNVQLLDVRAADAFQRGRIGDAIRVDPERFADQLSDLPKDRAIVAYCSGPLCIFAFEIAGQLRNNGYEVAVMPGGIAEWTSIGGELVR